MKQDVLLRDVFPYIEIWTLLIAAILAALAYHIGCFGKKYPEIFRPDTTAEDKRLLLQKEELRRQYNNKSMMSFSVIFVWMIGMFLICFGFNGFASTMQGAFIFVFSVCILLWIVSLIQRKPKK